MRSFASKISFPSAYAVLMLVIVLGAVLTWMLPAGRYDLLRYDQANKTFVAQRATGEERLPAEQATLHRLGIQIPIEHLEKGNIRKAVSIPGTYHTFTAKPQGVIAILKAPLLGTDEAIDKWVRFIWRLMALLAALSIIFLVLGVLLRRAY